MKLCALQITLGKAKLMVGKSHMIFRSHKRIETLPSSLLADASSKAIPVSAVLLETPHGVLAIFTPKLATSFRSM